MITKSRIIFLAAAALAVAVGLRARVIRPEAGGAIPYSAFGRA